VAIKPKGYNAFAKPLTDKIIVTKGLYTLLDKDELEAIVAHEVSHIFNRHGITRLAMIVIFYFPFLFFHFKYSAPEIFNNPLLFFLYLASFIWLFIGLRGMNWMSTMLERYADIQAIYLTKKPEALKGALLKVQATRLKTGKRPTRVLKIVEGFEWVGRYFIGFTHPAVSERIDYIEKYKLMSRNDEFKQD
jgi:Zn-dependent protease with chaperone function